MIFLVRHGQAQFKPSVEAALTEHGHTQARSVAGYLLHAGVEPARIISGSLLRQRETAADLAAELERLGARAGRRSEDPRLNEVNFPELNRHCVRVLASGGPRVEDASRLRAKTMSVLGRWRKGTLADTEPPERLMRRVRSALVELKGARRDVVVVTSSGVLDSVLRWCLGIPLDVLDTQLRSTWNLCGVTSLEWPRAARFPKIVTLNEVHHLPSEDRQRLW